jgi:hypothetical protein
MRLKQFRDLAPQVTCSTSLSAFFLLIVFVLSSCASGYRPINPKGRTFGSAVESNGIRYSTWNNILSDSGNKKYAKKETKKPVKLVALEITNTSDQPINFGRDVNIYMGDRLVQPVEPSVVYDQLRQRAGLYMLWSFFCLTYTKCEGEDCSAVPIPLGVIIGIGNASVAGSANKKFMAELAATNILTKVIAPGETVKGLIGISSDVSGSSISLKIE